MTPSAESAPAPVDTTAIVESPEHVRFHHHVAGPAKRGIAYLIDLMIRGIVILILAVALSLANVGMGNEGPGASIGLLLVVLFVVEWGYFVAFETLWSGRTPGKRALRLRVVTQAGHPLHFVDSVMRNLLRAADFLPAAYALGVAVMGRDRQFRRLGDLVAGTMVVVERKHQVEGPLRIHPAPMEEELARLPERVPLSGDDLEAIELFLRRMPKLSPARADELATLVAPIYARRLNLPVARAGGATRLLQLLYHRSRKRGT